MGKDGKFLPDGPDPEKTNNPASDFTFSVSYGDPQPVRALAKRDLNGDGTADAVTANFEITRNGVALPVHTAPTTQWNGGERGEVGDFYYHVMQGVVTGTQPGDSVKVWFTGAGQASESFTYSAKVESTNRVLGSPPRTTRASRPCTSQTRAPRTCPTTSTRWPRPATRPMSTTSTRTNANLRACSASSRTTRR